MEPSLGHDRCGSLQWLPARVMFDLPRWHTQRCGRCQNSRYLHGQTRALPLSSRCHQTADLLLCAAGLPISGKGRTYGTASSTVVRARALRGGGRRGGAPLGRAPEQELPASGSGGSSQQPARRRRRAPLHEQVARHHLSHLPTHEGARSAQCEADQRHGHGASSGSPQPYITGPPRHPTSRMLSPPTPGIGGEVARSESKQGGG